MNKLILVLLFLTTVAFGDTVIIGGYVPPKIDLQENNLVINFTNDYEVFYELNEDGTTTMVIRIK